MNSARDLAAPMAVVFPQHTSTRISSVTAVTKSSRDCSRAAIRETCGVQEISTDDIQHHHRHQITKKKDVCDHNRNVHVVPHARCARQVGQVTRSRTSTQIMKE